MLSASSKGRRISKRSVCKYICVCCKCWHLHITQSVSIVVFCQNKAIRKEVRTKVTAKKSVQELQTDIDKIRRQEAMGQADSKMLIRKRILEEAKSKAVSKQLLIAHEPKPKEEEVVIKGWTKIFGNNEPKPAPEGINEDEDEGGENDMRSALAADSAAAMVVSSAPPTSGGAFSKEEEESMYFDPDELEVLADAESSAAAPSLPSDADPDDDDDDDDMPLLDAPPGLLAPPTSALPAMGSTITNISGSAALPWNVYAPPLAPHASLFGAGRGLPLTLSNSAPSTLPWQINPNNPNNFPLGVPREARDSAGPALGPHTSLPGPLHPAHPLERPFNPINPNNINPNHMNFPLGGPSSGGRAGAAGGRGGAAGGRGRGGGGGGGFGGFDPLDPNPETNPLYDKRPQLRPAGSFPGVSNHSNTSSEPSGQSAVSGLAVGGARRLGAEEVVASSSHHRQRHRHVGGARAPARPKPAA